MSENLETVDIVTRLWMPYRTLSEPPPPRDDLVERHIAALALELTGIYPDWSRDQALNESRRRLLSQGNSRDANDLRNCRTNIGSLWKRR